MTNTRFTKPENQLRLAFITWLEQIFAAADYETWRTKSNEFAILLPNEQKAALPFVGRVKISFTCKEFAVEDMEQEAEDYAAMLQKKELTDKPTNFEMLQTAIAPAHYNKVVK